MRALEFLKREKEIVSQYKSIGIPTNAELASSDNVVWVNEYSRSDGTQVRGHWRAKPGQGKTDIGVPTILDEKYPWDEKNKRGTDENAGCLPVPSEDGLPDDVGVDFDNPILAASQILLKLAEIIFEDTEAGEILKIFNPIITAVVSKITEDDNVEEYDYSEESDDKVPWENTQPSRPEENSTKEISKEIEKQTSSNSDAILTGGASDINKYPGAEISALKNEGLRLKQDANISQAQQTMINYNNDKNALYKDARDLLNISVIGTKNLENTKDYTVLSNNQAAVRSKDIGYNLNNGNNTVEFSPNSSISDAVSSSKSLHKTIENWSQKPVKERESSISVTLKDDQNLFRSLNNATIFKPEIKDGYFTGYLYDKYDFKLQWFSDWEIFKANTGAYFLQEIKQLENYNIIIPIKVKLWKGKEVLFK